MSFEQSFEFDIDQLSQLDRGTLQPENAVDFMEDLTKSNIEYKPFCERVGPGLVTASSILKTELDKALSNSLNSVISNETSGRFEEAYVDVRIYPKNRYAEQWVPEDDWEGDDLHVVIGIVLAVPLGDSLDTVTRFNVGELFQEDSEHGFAKSFTLDAVGNFLASLEFDHFSLNYLFSGGVALNVVVDGCAESEFSELAAKSRGEKLPGNRFNNEPMRAESESIQLSSENVDVTIPRFISELMVALGGPPLAVENLQRNDSLLALADYDSQLASSFEASFKARFDILDPQRLATVGAAIDFAREMCEYYEDDNRPIPGNS